MPTIRKLLVARYILADGRAVVIEWVHSHTVGLYWHEDEEHISEPQCYVNGERVWDIPAELNGPLLDELLETADERWLPSGGASPE